MKADGTSQRPEGGWGVLEMAAAPVAGVLGGGANSTVLLVSDSSLPASSVKVTRSLMPLPSSSAVTM